MLLFIPTIWINTLFIITIILLLVLFHLIIVAFYPNHLDQYALHYTYNLIASFISSYYCCFLSQPIWININTLFIITIIFLLVLFHLIIVAFYPNNLDQYTLHYNYHFMASYYFILLLLLFIPTIWINTALHYTYNFIASFISSYYCCFFIDPNPLDQYNSSL